MNGRLKTCYLCNINFTSTKCPRCKRKADYIDLSDGHTSIRSSDHLPNNAVPYHLVYDYFHSYQGKTL